MSTLSISPAFVTGPAERPRLANPTNVRLTRRGRVVFLMAFFCIAFGVMIAAGGWATATRDGGTPDSVRIIEVQPGDTLYDIAGQVAKPGEVRSMIHEIQQLNSLSGGGLQVGQKIAIPTD